MTGDGDRRRFRDLLHAHLDGDASNDGELRAMAAAHDGLGREFTAASEIAGGLRALPAPALPEKFSDRVMARIDAEPRSFRERLKGLLAVPALRYAAAAALLIAVLAVGFLLGRHTGGQEPNSVSKGSGTVTVRFVYDSPSATRVHVVGDFNRWRKDVTPLVREGGGRWTAEVELKPGRYGYLFYVDDRQWAPDPAAPLVEDDGFGRKNSVLEI